MPRFERSRGRETGERSYRNNFPRRDTRDTRGSGRDSSRGYGRDRPEVQLTKVICASCGSECEVPFKPTSNKPVYCRDCFAQNGRGHSDARPSATNSSQPSNRDLDLINEKLNKIMKALKIE